jgi:hypothetical protein
MIGRFRRVLKRHERELDPLVKVAGVPTRRDAQACLDALEAKAIEAEIREDGQRLGTFELWVRASQEPQARLVMGLSGRSVIRLERHRGEGEGKG